MTELHPENKCAHLTESYAHIDNPLREIFFRQDALQRSVGLDSATMTPAQRLDALTKHWRNLTVEFAELLDRLPYKEWKQYTPEQVAAAFTGEALLESQYELIDMAHFFINMCLAMGLTWESFRDLYLSKNQENFDRQARGY